MSTTNSLKIGDAGVEFCLPDQNVSEVCLKSFQGKWVVLYFYPKDNTPGCTLEAQDFNARATEFEKLNAVILGISPDSTTSHEKFCKKYDLAITLLSDPSHEIIEKYGVWQRKSFKGKKYMGVVRSTFLIDPSGSIAFIWPKVSVKGHAEAVKEKITSLSQ
ncbi:MAG: thioredoxin-dependent thiol peroxidase [Candidatus Thorarchaeota archaeon]